MATRHALSDLSLLNLCPATPPGALFLLLTPSARLLTTLWRRRFMSSDKGKQKQPHPAISFSYLLLPAFFGLDRIFTFLVWPLHLLAPGLVAPWIIGFMAAIPCVLFWQDRRPCRVQW